MGDHPSTLSLLASQTAYQNKIFFRNPTAAFFTLLFPLMIFVVFSVIFGNEFIPELGINLSQYFGPAMAVFAAVSASYTNIAVTTAYQRDEGILKRVRGTPLPAGLYLGGKIVSAVIIATIAVVIMMAIGVAFYGIQIYAATLPAAIVTFFIGVGCFAALGLLVAGLVGSGEGATAVTNATLLPLAFVSGVFLVPSDDAPAWIDVVADFFPLKHFVVPFTDAFNPTFTGSPWQWNHLGYMALWGVVGLVLGIRFFKWEAPTGSRRRSRRRETAAT
ncbi:MAG TPA: ABC transporter permease [Acidimicrobiia bacterium]|nr:ABC transporter permease [Acidimicrobiia bacterium]